MSGMYMLQAAQCQQSELWLNLIGSAVMRWLRPCKIGLSNLCVTESGAKPNVSATGVSTYQVRPSIRAFVMLEPSAWKQACSVLRELGDGDTARLPGYALSLTWYQYMVPFLNEAQASENARANLQTTH